MQDILVQEKIKFPSTELLVTKRAALIKETDDHIDIKNNPPIFFSKKNRRCGCLILTGAAYCEGHHLNLP